MGNVDANLISEVLIGVLGVMFFILIILIVVFFVLRIKDKSISKKQNKKELIKDRENNEQKEKNKNINNVYSKQSIMDFMNFEKVEDNMIVQKKGKYLILFL